MQILPIGDLTPNVMPNGTPSKNGYVKSYKIDIISNHSTDKRPFLVVTLTDDENGTVAPEEFVIFRNISSLVNKSGTDYWAVSYSNLIQAIIATVKEAFIHREKVIIEYIAHRAWIGMRPEPEWMVGKKKILSIQIYK